MNIHRWDNNREDGVKIEDCVKTEDDEMIDNVHNRYIDKQCKKIYIFTNGLKDGDLHLTNFDNQIDFKKYCQ